MARIPVSIADYVGRTPMLELTRIAPPGVRLFGKLESFNPGGSVKDRIGVAMIEAAEADGLIEPGRSTIVEATSGNTGIALAFVCAAKGYDLVLTLPQGMSREREGLLRLYGARVQITESLGGMNEAVERRARWRGPRRLPARPVLQPGQPGSPPPHDRPRAVGGAGRQDRRARCGVGTGGTITGAGEYLEASNPDVPSSRSSPAPPRCFGRRARAAQDPGHRRRLRPAGPQPRDHRRGGRRRRRGCDPDRARRRSPRGRARRHLLRRRARRRDRGRPAPGVQGKADRRRAAGLRRALRLDAVLRAIPGLPSVRRQTRVCPPRLRCPAMFGLWTLARVIGEVRRDVAAAHARDPAARGAGRARSSRAGPASRRCSPIAWPTGCTRSACPSCRARCRWSHASGPGSRSTRRRGSGRASSSTTAPASSSARRPRSATT